jgi:precorrin-3B methylase
LLRLAVVAAALCAAVVGCGVMMKVVVVSMSDIGGS